MEKKKEKSNLPTHKKEENNNLKRFVNNINNVDKIDDKSSCELNTKPAEEESCDKEVLEPVQNTPITTRLRSRNRNLKITHFPALNSNDDSSDETEESDVKTKKVVVNKIKQSEIKKQSVPNETVTSLALSKITHDVKIDPNVVDRYTERAVPEVAEAMMPPPESPETKRSRIERENMVVARQCRLHPANKKYNQGPVVNPPLISPGKMVGYTPAGQRHEVDLNFERPTWFNSEYARMQFDDATRINVSRMFHDLRTGHFLPDSLDANVERRYFAEQELVAQEATEHFEQCACLSNPPPTTTDEETISLLESERQLIELNEFAMVKFRDFPAELASRLKDALAVKLTPLMFKKNPIIVETIEKLSSQNVSYEVAFPARALLSKIKSLFDVPKSQTFREYFLSEVESLMERTKDMNTYDLMMMTEEPSVADKCSVGEETQQSPPPDHSGSTQPSSDESEDEWEPVQAVNRQWEDSTDSDFGSNGYHSSGEDSNYGDDDDSYLSDTDSDWTDYDDSDAWTISYTSDDTDVDEELVYPYLINGMVVVHEIPGFLIYDFFEYI